MPINDQVEFTWVGHGTWLAKTAAGKHLLLDAWVQSNPVAPDHLKRLEKLDVLALTHAHWDHIDDAVEIAREHRPAIVCSHELGVWLASKGVEGAGGNEMNIGGTQEVEGIRFTMVHAEHSCGIRDGDRIVYGGQAAGYVIEFESGFKVYFAGDTDVFGDMALIAELHRPQVAFLPIGGHYTMSPDRATRAVQLLGVETVVPMHFGTFPALTGRPAELQRLVGQGVRVLDIQPGDAV